MRRHAIASIVVMLLGTLPGCEVPTSVTPLTASATSQLRGAPAMSAPLAGVAIQDLGTLGTNSFAMDVNDAGQIVGVSNLANGDRRAFLWTSAAGMTNLGTLGGNESEATGINRGGTIIGGSFTPAHAWHGWRRPAGGSMQDLTALDQCCTHMGGINDLGVITGYQLGTPMQGLFIWHGPGNVQQQFPFFGYGYEINIRGEVVGSGGLGGFFWSPTTGMQDVGSFNGGYTSAISLNNLGQVVGFSADSPGLRAFLWQSPGPMQRLGSLGGYTSYPLDINDLGQVVGWSHTAANDQRAFLWTSTGGMQELPTLGGESTAWAINNVGQIVGYSATATGALHATRWTLPPALMTQSLADAVAALVAAGTINAGQGNALLAKLSAALQKIAQGSPLVARNQLQAFINQVQALMNAGTLTAAQGQLLIDAANAVIAQL